MHTCVEFDHLVPLITCIVSTASCTSYGGHIFFEGRLRGDMIIVKKGNGLRKRLQIDLGMRGHMLRARNKLRVVRSTQPAKHLGDAQLFRIARLEQSDMELIKYSNTNLQWHSCCRHRRHPLSSLLASEPSW